MDSFGLNKCEVKSALVWNKLELSFNRYSMFVGLLRLRSTTPPKFRLSNGYMTLWWWFVLFRETCRWSYKLSVIPPAVREKHIRSTFLWLSVAFTILLIYKVESDSAAAAHTHCRLYSHRGFEPLNTFCWMCYRKQAFSSPLSENAVNRIRPSGTHLHRVVCSDFHQVLDELSSMLKVDVGCK